MGVHTRKVPLIELTRKRTKVGSVGSNNTDTKGEKKQIKSFFGAN